jgi:ferredoxin-NADP reductase
LPAFSVRSIRTATPTTRCVRLDLGGAPFPFSAGQAAKIGLADCAERKPYSIASAPEETRRDGVLEFLIKLESNGAWGSHLAGLKRGSSVAVEGPLGTFAFPDRPEERDLLFVAGGTGIAPLRSMIRQAIETNQPGRIRLLYSARTPSDFAYLPELRRLAREGRIDLKLTATREVPPRWRGDRGRITLERLAPLVTTPETLSFVCGPTAMVDAVPRMLQELGIDRRRIRIEEW